MFEFAFEAPNPKRFKRGVFRIMLARFRNVGFEAKAPCRFRFLGFKAVLSIGDLDFLGLGISIRLGGLGFCMLSC